MGKKLNKLLEALSDNKKSISAGSAIAAGALYTPEENQAQAGVVSKIAGKLDDAKLPEVIKIDGIERPTRNSKGELIGKTEKEIKNFWGWFGDSELVDNSGRPLVVRHFTDADIKEFDNKKSDGFWFTTKEALDDEVGASGGKNVIEAYLNSKNITRDGQNYDVEDFLNNSEYDALENRYDGFTDYATVNPNAIKSVKNSGDFSSTSNDIYGAATPQGIGTLAALSGGANAIYNAAKNNTLGEAANYAQDAANMVGYIPTMGMMTTSDIIGGIGKAGAAVTGNLDAYNREVSPYVERAGETQSQLGIQAENALASAANYAAPYVAPYVAPALNNLSQQWQDIEATPGAANIYGWLGELNRKSNIKFGYDR